MFVVFMIGAFALTLVAMVVMARWQSRPSGSAEYQRPPGSPGTDPGRGIGPGNYGPSEMGGGSSGL